MKKGSLITAIVAVILILSVVIYFFQSFSIFGSEQPVYISEHSLGVKGSIKFFYINSPVSASCIQVRKIDKETNEEYLLENYEHYNNMVGYCLRGDSMTIFLRKGYWLGRQSSNFIECDTFHLNINDVKWKLK